MIENSPVRDLAGLDDAEITKMKDIFKLTNVQDMIHLNTSDFERMIGNGDEHFLKVKKLCTIAEYLKKGGTMNSTTTMTNIMVYLNLHQAANTTSSNSSTTSYAPIRLSPSDFPKFTGDIEDQELYKAQAESVLGQTAFKFLLTRDAKSPQEKERDEELYNLFKGSFLGGKAYHLISESLKDANGNTIAPSGRTVWKNFLSWCNSGGRQQTLINSTKKSLKALKLDGVEMDGFEYVNQFIQYYNKLIELKTNPKDSDMIHTFVDNIIDNDFDTVKQLLSNNLLEVDKGNRVMDKKEYYDMVQNRQRYLNAQEDEDMELKSRKTTTDGHRSRSTSPTPQPGSISKQQLFRIFQVPVPLWKSWNDPQKNAFKIWKSNVCAGKKTSFDEISAALNKSSDQGGQDSEQGGRKKRRKNNKKTTRTVLCRNTKQSAPLPEDVQILMKPANSKPDPEEEEELPNISIEEENKKCNVTKVVRKLDRETQMHTIVDSGTEWTIVGGPAWTIVKDRQRRLKINGADADMQAVSIPLYDSVTAVTCTNGSTVLIGVRNGGYSNNLNDNEAVINDHFIREMGWLVDCVADRHGGTQSITPAGGDMNIPLEYDSVRYKMTIKSRKPTEIEMKELKVNWIDCHTEDLKIGGKNKPARRQPFEPTYVPIIHATSVSNNNDDEAPQPLATRERMDESDDESDDDERVTSPKSMETDNDDGVEKTTKPESTIDWCNTLGGISDEVLQKTLEHTTQYYPTSIESENRDYPRQHRQKRLHALHYKRIPGKTCGDTFFSSIRSKRGFTCVQLFVALTWDYVWVKLLRRESQVPGAYMDFVQEVGAPNMLLTDNSKVQSGKKFEEINRKNQTDHVFSTPHCQNQNQSERKIQDVKHRAILLMKSSMAPLVFWCYAIKFIVDCLNHTAKPGLDWQVPATLKDGSTKDISVFRYEFWQPVEYLEPQVKFPDCKWRPARFLGPAWDTGDPFTYYIWTEPDSKGWKGGSELIRNVIRPRKLDKEEETGDTAKLDQFDLQLNRNILKEKIQESQKKRKKNETSRNKRRKKNQKKEDSSSEVNSDTVEESQPTLSFKDTPTVRVFDPASSAGDDTVPNDIENETINDGVMDATGKQGGVYLVQIDGHRWEHGRLQLRYQMSTDSMQWVDAQDAKVDHPKRVATYLLTKYKSRSRDEGRDRHLSWAKKTLRDMDRAVRRISRLYDFYLDDNDDIKRIRRNVKAKKKYRGPPKTQMKYGIEVPRTVKEAFELDEKSGNTKWRDAIKKEMDALEDLNCFEFHDKDFTPDPEFQRTKLHMIFTVKQDLRHKARLVAGGHLIDVLDNEVYASTVKGISVKLLHVIAHDQKLEPLCGDIGNAFVTAYTKEKVYCIAGPEFGEKQGMIVVIRKALYGLATSAAAFRSALGDNLRDMGFSPTRFDNDVWIRKAEEGDHYEYICTHVDDFCIFSRKPQPIMDAIQKIYTVKDIGPPNYYLGNDYKKDKEGKWTIGCKKYITEAVRRIEAIFGKLTKRDTPLVSDDHPEMDGSALLDDAKHKQYQMLIGILNWIVVIGRIDVCYAVTSLSRFVACPREGHLDRALHVFGYLKKRPNKRIKVDSSDPIIMKNGAEHILDKDLAEGLKEHYPDSEEILDPKLPEPLLNELAVTVYVDSDHAHDKLTRRSVTGLLIFVGRTPVYYFSKRQGAIETSTYGAEFMAMKTAVEEVMAVRYMLRCLGVPITKPTTILGDNRSVIINSTVPSSLLKKKHVAISYHMVREAAAAKIVRPVKTRSEWNYADLLTKPLTRKSFLKLLDEFM